MDTHVGQSVYVADKASLMPQRGYYTMINGMFSIVNPGWQTSNSINYEIVLQQLGILNFVDWVFTTLHLGKNGWESGLSQETPDETTLPTSHAQCPKHSETRIHGFVHSISSIRTNNALERRLGPRSHRCNQVQSELDVVKKQEQPKISGSTKSDL